MNIELQEQEAQSFYDAADELYDMYVEAADYVIENNLFFDIGVGFNLVEVIKKSWETDVHWHIYGAFKFGGGLKGEAIKLIGFDADTPSGLVKTSQEQTQDKQFNEIYEKISENFQRLVTLDDDSIRFEEQYDGWKILFSAPNDDEQKEETSRFLQHLADEAGFETGFAYLHEVEFSEDGVRDANGQEYEYWFKNYSWLEMASQEPELVTTLTTIMKNQTAIILNPAYTALFEAKGMINILKKLYPDSPYLQDTKEDTNSFAKIFFAYEACGLSFSNNSGEFIKHTII